MTVDLLRLLDIGLHISIVTMMSGVRAVTSERQKPVSPIPINALLLITNGIRYFRKMVLCKDIEAFPYRNPKRSSHAKIAHLVAKSHL